jgi:hypothetical protein
MKQFPTIERALEAIDRAAKELKEAMDGGADVNYMSLYAFVSDTNALRESFKTLVISRK